MLPLDGDKLKVAGCDPALTDEIFTPTTGTYPALPDTFAAGSAAQGDATLLPCVSHQDERENLVSDGSDADLDLLLSHFEPPALVQDEAISDTSSDTCAGIDGNSAPQESACAAVPLGQPDYLDVDLFLPAFPTPMWHYASPAMASSISCS